MVYTPVMLAHSDKAARSTWVWASLVLLLAAMVWPSTGHASSWLECRYDVRVERVGEEQLQLELIAFLGGDGSIQPDAATCRQTFADGRVLYADIGSGAGLGKAGARLRAIRRDYSGMGPQGPVVDSRWELLPAGPD